MIITLENGTILDAKRVEYAFVHESNKRAGEWQVRIGMYSGTELSVPCYDSEEEACAAMARIERAMKGKK